MAHQCTWEVLESNHGSDHFSIVTRINDFSSKLDFGRPSISTYKVDWHIFQDECTKFSEDFHIDLRNLNSSYDAIITKVQQSLILASASYHKPNHLRRRDHEIIRKKNHIFKRYKNSPSIVNLHCYSDPCKETSKIFKKKRESFRNFCSSLSIDTPIPKVWNYIRTFANKKNRTPCSRIISELSSGL